MRYLLLMPLVIFIAGASAQELQIRQNHLDYIEKLGERSTADLNMIVIHATEQPDWPHSRAFAEKIRYGNATGASGHYYIDRTGNIEQYVPDNRIANHASGWNKKTLSVELINTGRYPNATHTEYQNWPDDYPVAQIDALISLMVLFKRRYPTIKYIQGHGDVDQRLIPSSNDPDIEVHRRIDPGTTFPWDDVINRIDLIKEKPGITENE